MMSFSVLFACILSLVVAVSCHPVGNQNDNVLIQEDKLESRSLPVSLPLEYFLQYVLRTDQHKCMLRLVCIVGDNATRYGSYGDAVASHFGYFYNPHDFSVAENTHALEKLGRPADPLASEQVAPTTNVTLKIPLLNGTVDDGISNITDPELFNLHFIDARNEPAFESELEERSFFPAMKVFNRAFLLGFKGGRQSCEKTFPGCAVDLDFLIRSGINMFNNSNRPLTAASN